MEMSSAKLIRELHDPIRSVVQTTREAVAARLRGCASGVAPAAAQRRTQLFYRSSGQAWALTLG